ncbi:MAG: putative sulfate exporter family transporter [Deltaproteobacteria bacterium]|nr:putative sulfate exporter family transporter [Deltaproteobacteria bacterium]
MATEQVKKALFLLLAGCCALPFVTTTEALTAGILFSLLLGNPLSLKSSIWSKRLLQLSVVGLGFGLGIGEVWTVGKDSVVYTLIGITFTLALGALLRKIFPTGQKTAALIAFGTAICGGSAIAAMAPVLNSEDDETAVALATVFSLNAVALLLFPFIGHLLHLSQVQFGEWAALAIHDTSSVVGAAAAYGPQALAVGTTVKLTRAMWIAPVALGAALCLKSDKRAKIPVFIIGFVAAAVIHTLFPQLGALWRLLSGIAKQGLVVTLFLIGAGLSKSLLKKVGFSPLAFGITLWILVGGLALEAILLGWIH